MVLVLQGILQYVNKQLNLAQSRRRLLEYQSKLDTSALERSSHPIAQQFKVRSWMGGLELHVHTELYSLGVQERCMCSI